VISSILVLAALLDMEQTAPRMVSPHASVSECLIAAQKNNHQFKAELEKEENAQRGMRFVCLKLVSEV
jgi:hypothetical protein